MSSGMDSKIVNPDGGIHANRLNLQVDKESTGDIPIYFASEGWISSLHQFPSLSYSCVYANLVTNSPTPK